MQKSLKRLKNSPRKILKKTLLGIKRITRIGNYWYWLDKQKMEEEIEIIPIICPLRYDVFIRRDFFCFYAEHQDLYKSDFNTFVKLARQHPYYHWFTKVVVVRFLQHLRDDQTTINKLYIQRLKDSVTLYENIIKNGFDPQFPITLNTGHRILPTETGKSVATKYFITNGCHRLACLMALGYTKLPKEHVCVKIYREFKPIDNTSLLIPHIPINPQLYFSFLSLRYGNSTTLQDRESLVEYVKENKPDYLQELLSIIQIDQM